MKINFRLEHLLAVSFKLGKWRGHRLIPEVLGFLIAEGQKKHRLNMECLKCLIFTYVSVLLGWFFYALVPFPTVDVHFRSSCLLLIYFRAVKYSAVHSCFLQYLEDYEVNNLTFLCMYMFTSLLSSSCAIFSIFLWLCPCTTYPILSLG